MTDIAKPRVRRAVELAMKEAANDGRGPTLKSDGTVKHTLREGYRVHALVRRESEDEDPEIVEVYPAVPGNDPGETVSIDADAVPLRSEVSGTPQLVAAVEATLGATFHDDRSDTLGLMDVEVGVYSERTTFSPL